MKRDIESKLKSLNSRRSGADRLGEISLESIGEVLAKSLKSESYTKRSPSQKHTQYVLGAMQEVDPDYTKISLEEADRVGNQLKKGLEKKDITVEFRIQGSVAANLHIRGVSDVDILTLDSRYHRYSTEGSKAKQGSYKNPVSYNTLDSLVLLRKESETILESAFPAAKVKTDGPKAINLTGGSLRRPVDVVPANWFDTDEYQDTNSESDRGVEILDKSVPVRILNMPFKHIFKISQRDALALGGLKKAIRLVKNVKADAEVDGAKIELSSFDIASAIWHSDITALTVGIANELAILAETTRFLDLLTRNRSWAQGLKVPDGSRVIFDSEKKWEALTLLSLEMDDISERVSREQKAALQFGPLSIEARTKILRESYIPDFQ
jgi:hypothetical protein